MPLPVTKIQRFSTGDGPGVRTTVFFRGCPLRCRWCHNPETASDAPAVLFSPRLCVGCRACEAACRNGAHSFGETGHTFARNKCVGCGACAGACLTGALEMAFTPMSEGEIFREVAKDAAFYGKTGGITVSGGEPTLQGEKLLSLLRRCREAGFTTAVETCGLFPEALAAGLAEVTDLFLWDVKDTDPARHAEYTGAPLGPVIYNLRRVDSLGGETVLRCIIVNGVNLTEEHLRGIAALYRELRHCRGVELIPHHTYGAAKREQLGLPPDPHPEWTPAGGDMLRANGFLARYVPVIKH